MRVAYRVVLAVMLALVIGLTPPAYGKACSITSIGLTPLTDLGAGQYLGHVGGLYPGGSNEVPAEHLDLGLDLAAGVEPLDALGSPDGGGVIGVISIGVSNTSREFGRFIEIASVDPGINPQIVFVNGAQGGQALEEWSVGPEAGPWSGLTVDVAGAGITPEQVQVAWVKLPSQDRGTPDVDEADAEVDQLANVIRIAKDKFPNLRLAYVSSRIYAGYAGGPRSEPGAYQNGFAVRMLVERQIEGDPQLNADPDVGQVSAPWLAWGPYMWADGVVPRSDGLVWECDDFDEDGLHPASEGSDKAAELLMQHFSTHATTTGWFLGGPSSSSATTTTSAPTTRSSERSTTREERTREDRAPAEERPSRVQPERVQPESNQPESAQPEAAEPAVPESAQSERLPPGSRTGSTGFRLNVPWLVAGVVVGLGASLTLWVTFGDAATPRDRESPEDS